MTEVTARRLPFSNHFRSNAFATSKVHEKKLINLNAKLIQFEVAMPSSQCENLL